MKNQKGFTLIELSIVLVIIGIILGAVLKGQDLINNARAKKLIQWEKQWETSIWTYMDRMGRFPGDAGADGIIGNNASDTNSAYTDISNANFINTPPQSLTIGSYSYYIGVGNDGGHNSGATVKNVIIMCKNSTCSTNLVADDLQFMQTIDNAIDGLVAAGAGNVRGLILNTGLNLASNNLTLPAASIDTTNTTSWSTTANTYYGLVYWFDRPY